MALALEFYRSAPKYLGARTLGSKAPGLAHGRARAAPARDPEGSGTDARGVGAREAAPGRHLRQRPLDDRRAVLVLLLAARVAAVRARPRGRRRAPGRLSATSWPGSVSCSRASSDAPHAGEDPPCEHCAAGQVGPLRPGHRRPPEAGAPDRLLHGDRRRVEPADARAPITALAGSRWDGRRDRGADRAARVRDPRGVPREGPGGRHRARRRRRHGRHPHADRDQGAHESGSRDRGGEAPAPARRGVDGRRRRRRASGARREGRPPDGSRGEAHPGARDGVPARWRRRGDRVHGVEQRARSGAPHDEGGRAHRRLRHPRRAAPISPRCGSASSSSRARTRPASRTSAKGVTRPTFEMAIELASNLPDARTARRRDLSAWIGGATRSTTRWPPARSARSRWRSRRRPRNDERGQETTTDAQTRIRARGGRADASVARPRGGGLPHAEVPPRDARGVSARCRCPGIRDVQRGDPSRAAPPAGGLGAAPRAAEGRA